MRDYRGVPFSRVEDPVTRDALAQIDYFLKDIGPGFQRIQQGQVPTGSGAPIPPGGPPGSLEDYLYLPGRLGGQTVEGITGDLSPTVTLNAVAVGTPIERWKQGTLDPLSLTTENNSSSIEYTFLSNRALNIRASNTAVGFRFTSQVGTASTLRAFFETAPGGSELAVTGINGANGNTIQTLFSYHCFNTWTGLLLSNTTRVGINTDPFEYRSSAAGNQPDSLIVARRTGASTGVPTAIIEGTSSTEYALALTGVSVGSNPNKTIAPVVTGFRHDGFLVMFDTTGASLAGTLGAVSGAGGGRKFAFTDRFGSRSLSIDAIDNFWADTRRVSFLDLGRAVLDGFRAVTISGIDSSTMDRLSIHSLGTLIADVNLSGSTAIPGALLHLRNSASASKVVERIQPHASQSVDIWQVRDATDAVNQVRITSAGLLEASMGSLFIDNTVVPAIEVQSEDAASTYDGLGLLISSVSAGFKAKLCASPSMTTDINVVLPSAGATLIGTTETVTVTNKRLGTGTVLRVGSSAADTNGCLFGEGASTTGGFRINAAATPAATIRDIEYSGLTGYWPLVGNDAPAVASGALGKVDLTAQAAAITSTNLSSTPPAGFYLIQYEIACTTGDATAGTIQLDVTVTGDGGSITTSSAALSLVTANVLIRGTMERYLASGDIAYAVPVTGAVNAARFAGRIRVTALG